MVAIDNMTLERLKRVMVFSTNKKVSTLKSVSQIVSLIK